MDNENTNMTPAVFDCEQVICVPVDRFANMIRAVTELGIIEAAIDTLASYEVEKMLKIIRIARAKYVRKPAAKDSEETPDA